jgi:hypothetical protein
MYYEPDIPTYISRSGTSTSTIDLIFSSPTINHNIINWAIGDEHGTGPDHLR